MRHYIIAFLTLFLAAQAHAMDVTRFPVGENPRTVYFVHDDYAPIVSVMAAFDKAGYAYEPEETLGIGALTLDMLEEGGGVVSPKKFRRYLDAKHASVSVAPDVDTVFLHITALSNTLPEVMRKVADIIAAPQYAAADFTRYVNAQSTAIKMRKTIPAVIAGRELKQLIYPDHPYNRSALGDGENVASFTPELATAYHRAAFRPANVYFGVAGDISKEDAEELLRDFLSKIDVKADENVMAMAESIPKAEYGVKKYTYKHIEKDLPQTAITFALPGVTRDDPKFFDYYVANYMLGGGGFESHLMAELREKQGLAYSVASSLSYDKRGAAIVGSAATAPDKLQKFVAGLKESVSGPADMEKSGDIARQYLRHSFTLSLARNSSVAAMLAGLALYDLPTDYLSFREKAILAAKGDSLHEIFKKAWTSDRLAVVSVGPKGE